MNKSRSGAALVIVMVIVMVMVAAGAGLVGLASQESYVVTRIRDQIKAQAIAEAGANEAYSILKADFDKKSDPSMFPETAFDGGTYDATIITYESEPAKAHIICVATYENVEATVKCDVKDFSEPVEGGSTPVGAYAYAIVAGQITWGGEGATDVGSGDVVANGKYNMAGEVALTCGKLWAVTQVRSVGESTITGDAEAPEFKNKSPGNISGSATVAGVAPVGLPGLDLLPYYQHALANGEVWDGDQVLGPRSPAGGVMWVNGDLMIAGNSPMSGCYIATGDIKITNAGDQSQVGDLPAYISRDGDIELNSAASHAGLVYAMTGDITMSGGGSITGTLLCAGEFKKTGAWAAIAYVDSTPPDDPAGGGGEPAPEVGITAWHR
jgi:hypothetical protein